MQIHNIDPPLSPTVSHPLNSGMQSKIMVGRRPSQFDSIPVIKDPPSCPKLLKLAEIHKVKYCYFNKTE